jgi:hypothetical protein
MEVYCEICKTKQLSDDCWCVIDVKAKIRYFECRVSCKPPPLIKKPSMETFELDMEDKEDSSETILVEDWIVKPHQSWIQWMKELFGFQSYRYMKVKTN